MRILLVIIHSLKVRVAVVMEKKAISNRNNNKFRTQSRVKRKNKQNLKQLN
jgi:hypothetical protein